MTLEEYLGTESCRRKLLVISSVSKGNELLRLYAARTCRPVRNTVCITLRELALTVYRYGMAEANTIPARLLESSAAAVLLRRVVLNLNEELQFFTDENMLTLPMAVLLYRTVALLRANGWTGNEDDNDPKIRDLKRIIPAFEAAMEASNQMDDVLLMQTAVSVIRGWAEPAKTVHGLLGVQLACVKEDTEQLNNAELAFLVLLQQAINGEERTVSVFDGEPAPGTLPAVPTETAFFRGYGHYNEANYIANDIARSGYAPGDVEVLCTSQSQLPAIHAALCGNGIPAAVLSAAPAAGDPYLRLVARILDWSADDYSETALKAILASHLVNAPYTADDGSTHNAVRWTNYFRHILEPKRRFDDAYILGWDYQRNCEFIESERMLTQEPRTLAALELHAGLLDVFRSQDGTEYVNVSPCELYGKIEAFLDAFTKPLSAADGAGKNAFYQLRAAAEQETEELPLPEAICFIRDLLDGAMTSDGSSDAAVSVRLTSDWRLSDRRYLYLIGLSFRDLQQDTTESPVLSDSELCTVLQNGAAFTTAAKTQQREKNICRTIAGFSGDCINFGYSSFDADYFCESNPSLLFCELMHSAETSFEELPEFVYGSHAEDTLFPAQAGDALCAPPRSDTSPSSLERLLSCPKRYAFEKLLYLPDKAPAKKEYFKWLDALQAGSFFHKIAERYVREVLFLPTGVALPEQADADRIARIIAEEYADLRRRIPAAVDSRAERERRDTQDMFCDYAVWLQAQMNEEGRRPLLVEQDFSDAGLTLTDHTGKEYTFTVKGAIDRIDYRLLPDENKIELRIADYKTGKLLNKKSEDKLGLLLQQIFYEKALMDNGQFEGTGMLQYVKEQIAQREQRPELARWEAVFGGFYYEFPKELCDYRPMNYDLAQCRLRTVLTVLSTTNCYPDPETFAALLPGLMEEYVQNDPTLAQLASLKPNTGNCGSCVYKEICGKHEEKWG